MLFVTSVWGSGRRAREQQRDAGEDARGAIWGCGLMTTRERRAARKGAGVRAGRLAAARALWAASATLEEEGRAAFAVFKSTQSWFDEAQRWLRAGQVQQARDAFAACVDRDPLHGAAWYGLARTEGMLSGGLRCSIAVLHSAVRRNENNPKLWQTLGRLQFRTRQRQRARDSFRRALVVAGTAADAMPARAALYAVWATAEARDHNEELAASLFAAGMAACPTSSRCAVQFARFKARHNDLDGALALLHDALADAPHEPRVMQALGAIYARMNLVADARAWLEKAITASEALDSHRALGSASVPSRLAYELYGRLEATLGRFDAAFRILQRGAIRFPRCASFKTLLALLEIRAGNLLAARTHAVGAVRIASRRNALPLNVLAFIELELGDRARASTVIEHGCKLHPDDWLLHSANAQLAWDMNAPLHHAISLTKHACALRHNASSEPKFSLLEWQSDAKREDPVSAQQERRSPDCYMCDLADCPREILLRKLVLSYISAPGSLPQSEMRGALPPVTPPLSIAAADTSKAQPPSDVSQQSPRNAAQD